MKFYYFGWEVNRRRGTGATGFDVFEAKSESAAFDALYALVNLKSGDTLTVRERRKVRLHTQQEGTVS